MSKTLAAERTYLKKNQERLRRRYPGKYLLIKGSKVHGAYDTREAGVLAGVRRFPDARAFLVRPVDQPEDPVVSNPALSLGIPLSCSS